MVSGTVAEYIAELICRERTCMSYNQIRNMGATPEAVFNAPAVPCTLIAVKAGGVHWACAQGAPVPLPILHVIRLIENALERAKNGYVIIYYRQLMKLPHDEFRRAMRILYTVVHKCGCEVRARSYKCSAQCTAEFLNEIRSAANALSLTQL